MGARLAIKLFLRRFMLINSFCKECGIDIADYAVDDDFWWEMARVHRSLELCAHCFARRVMEMNRGEPMRVSRPTPTEGAR